jgi:hypothetical protein
MKTGNAFIDAFDHFTGEVIDAGFEASKQLVEIGYRHLVDVSPIWSGSYVLSHRVKLGDMPARPPTNIKRPDPKGGIYPLKVSDERAARFRRSALVELNKLKRQEKNVPITIENDISHSLIVEATERAPFQQVADLLRGIAEPIFKEKIITGRKKTLVKVGG